jgi:hypothetical protein
MAIDLKNILNYVAPAPTYLGKLEEAGMIKSEDLDALRNRSLVQGLLTAGLGYLAQPKTGRYGSALPYLGKAGLMGLQAMQQPYDQFGKDLEMGYKIENLNLERDSRNRTKEFVAEMIASGDPRWENLDKLGPSEQATAVTQYLQERFKANQIKPASTKTQTFVQENKVMEQELVFDAAESQKQGKEVWNKVGDPYPKYKPDDPIDMDYVNARAALIARGDAKPPTGRELYRPEGRAIFAKVMEINPNWSQMTYETAASSLKALDKQQQMVGAFEKTALANLDIALEYGMKVNNTQVPVFNRWKNAGMKNVAGDEQIAAFNAATETFANEYAKIMSGATGAAAATEGARAEAQSLLNSAMSWGQYKEVANVMRRDMTNRMLGFNKQKEELKQGLKDLEEFTGGAPKSSTRNKIQAGQVVNGYMFKGGNPNDKNNWEKI